MKFSFLTTIAAVATLCGCSRITPPERVEWPVMGTIAAFQCRDKNDLAKAAIVRDTFAEIEKLLNAHNPQSELSIVAPLADDELLTAVSPLVRPCYLAAFQFRDESNGVFNPRYKGAGTMDLGGIAKGFAVDLAVERVGKCDALVDLGGNLKTCGGSWRVGVMGRTGKAFTLDDSMRTCATSAEYYRGKHIKDGRSGKDAASAVYSITVVHPESATAADALSTILFILGREKGGEYLSSHHPSARAFWL